MDKVEVQRKMAEAYLQIMRGERVKAQQVLDNIDNEIRACEEALSPDEVQAVESPVLADLDDGDEEKTF